LSRSGSPSSSDVLGQVDVLDEGFELLVVQDALGGGPELGLHQPGDDAAHRGVVGPLLGFGGGALGVGLGLGQELVVQTGAFLDGVVVLVLGGLTLQSLRDIRSSSSWEAGASTRAQDRG
jgi:hypothetical protein